MNNPTGAGRPRYHIVVTHLTGTHQPAVFDEECDAYIVAVGGDHPTSITSLVNHRGPFRLREVLVQEIHRAVLDALN